MLPPCWSLTHCAFLMGEDTPDEVYGNLSREEFLSKVETELSWMKHPPFSIGQAVGSAGYVSSLYAQTIGAYPCFMND